MKTFADGNLIVAEMMKYDFDGLENNGERRKCWLPAPNPFPK